MPTGRLNLGVTDMAGARVAHSIYLEFTRAPGEMGAGAETVHAEFATPDDDLEIIGIPCRAGIGSTYKITAITRCYRPYAFFQLVRDGTLNISADDVAFWVKPGDVKGIRAAAFADLPATVRAMLDQAQMIRLAAEDDDLVGRAGGDLYDRLGPLRRACLLNIAAKAAHGATTGNCLPSIGALLACRQDRIYAQVSANLPDVLTVSPLFKSAPASLHDPLPGYVLTGQSFKSQDAHANLQVTIMRRTADGALAADIDIDEASGIRHGLEVIENATFRRRTNPYLIREFLLAADPINRSLNPGYEFTF